MYALTCMFKEQIPDTDNHWRSMISVCYHGNKIRLEYLLKTHQVVETTLIHVYEANWFLSENYEFKIPKHIYGHLTKHCEHCTDLIWDNVGWY